MSNQFVFTMECADCGESLELEPIEVYNIVRVKNCKKCGIPKIVDEDIIFYCSKCGDNVRYTEDLKEQTIEVIGCDCIVKEIEDLTIRLSETEDNITRLLNKIKEVKVKGAERLIREN